MEALEQRINELFWQHRKIYQPVELEMRMLGKIGNSRLSTDAGIHLYRVVQEAAQNAIKHSGATKLLVSLLRFNEFVKMIVEDNVKGFHWPPQSGQDHFGMTNMKRRAEIINGEFSVETSEGMGCRIIVAIPIN